MGATHESLAAHERRTSVGILPLDQVPLKDLIRNVEILLRDADAEFPLSGLNGLLLPDERFDEWGLPSHGESQPDCGSFYRVACFNLEDHPDGLAVFSSRVHRCFSPKCPVCWGAWALREAGRIEYRVLESQKKLPSLGLPIHVVASVPSWEYGLSKEQLAKKATRYVKEAGFLGGCCVFHQFRQDKISGLWYFSPHFHMIGFGWIEGAEDVYESKGWIVKNLGVRHNVFGTAFYQLTHCSVYYGPGRKHSVTWIGELAYNKGLKIPPKPVKPDLCPYCGETFQKVVWVGEGDPPLPCVAQDRFYLAKADGWSTREELYWAAINPFKDGLDPAYNEWRL
jgi:hypothetical protein